MTVSQEYRKNPPTFVGIAGVGRMGSGMARSLMAAGLRVVGWDPNTARRDALAAAGDQAAGALSSLRRAHAVILSLPTAQALQEAAAALASSAEIGEPIVIDTSTLPLAEKQAAQETLRQAGIVLLDAPVVGGALQATQGALTVLASGPRPAFERVLPVLNGTGAQQYYIGDFGEAIKFKLVINHLVGVSNLLIAETLQIAQGLDTPLLHEIVSGSSLGSGLWKARVSVMLDRAWAADPSRQSGELTVPLKDNALIAEILRQTAIKAPLMEAAIPLYEAGRRDRLEHQDPPVLLQVLAKMNAGARPMVAPNER